MSPRTEVVSDRPCGVCGTLDTTRWKPRSLDRELRSDDLLISDSRYGVTLSLWKCASCGFLFAPQEEIENLTSLYEELVDPGYEESQDSRVLQMRWLLRKALARRPGAVDLLEIGAGTGLLVREAREMGLDASGIEPSGSLVETAKTHHGVDLIQGVFPHPTVDGRRFDLVFLVDVIEHVGDPVQLLRDCGAALKPGGVVVVVTPDVSSIAARLLKQRWWHFRLAHVGYFDRKSLTCAATAARLVPERWVRAKWFFRVGYLAERTSRYLPVGWLNRLAERLGPLRWCYQRVIPLNLRDSYLVFLRRDGASDDAREGAREGARQGAGRGDAGP